MALLPANRIAGVLRDGSVGVVARPQHGNEDLPLGNLAAAGVGDRQDHSGVVDKQLLACGVDLAYGDAPVVQPASVVDCERSVLIAARVLRFILLLQQEQLYSLAPLLFRDLFPVGFGTHRSGFSGKYLGF